MGQFRKYKSLYSTTLSSSIGTGTGETITFASVTGVPTDTEITVTIDRVDASGNATPTKMERITGTLSGSNLTSYTREVEGTEQAHSGGAVVEMVWNAYDWNDAIDGVLAEHNQDGTHSAITASKVTSTVADTGNVIAGTFTQSDTTNNPIAVQIENDGTNHGLYIQQDGVLAAGDYALYIYSNAAQTNSDLVYITQDNASSNQDCLVINNDGTGNGLYVVQDGNGATAHAACYVLNNGTGHGYYLNQDGVLDTNKFGLYVYSNTAQTSGNLVRIVNDNASSTLATVVIDNDGSNAGVYIQQDGNSATYGALYVENNGTGHGTYVNQAGVLAGGKNALYVYSNAAQSSGNLFFIHQDNASSSAGVMGITNDGSGTCLSIDNNNSANSIAIDHDWNSAGNAVGITMAIDNAGAGVEAAFQFAGSEAVAAAVGGTNTHKVKVYVGGSLLYIPCYTA